MSFRLFVLLFPLVAFAQWRLDKDPVGSNGFFSKAYIVGARVSGAETSKLFLFISHQHNDVEIYLDPFNTSYQDCGNHSLVEVILNNEKRIAHKLRAELGEGNRSLFISNQKSYKKNWLDFFQDIIESDYIHVRLTSGCGRRIGVYRFNTNRETEAISVVVNEFLKSKDSSSARSTSWGVNTSLETRVAELNPFDLKSYVEDYVDYAQSFGIDVSHVLDNTIIIDFTQLPGTTIALARGMLRDSFIHIDVDPENWHEASPQKRYLIMMHELSHDILNAEHGKAGPLMDPVAPALIDYTTLQKWINQFFEHYN